MFDVRVFGDGEKLLEKTGSVIYGLRRELGDEYHYIVECTEFINERKHLF
jgi:hypothetical protein